MQPCFRLRGKCYIRDGKGEPTRSNHELVRNHTGQSIWEVSGILLEDSGAKLTCHLISSDSNFVGFHCVGGLSLVHGGSKGTAVDGQNTCRFGHCSPPSPLAYTVQLHLRELQEELYPGRCPDANFLFVLWFPWVLAQVNPSILQRPNCS